MRSFLSLFFLSIAIITNAQYDPVAKKHMDELSNKLKSYSAFKANFTYHLDGPSDLDETYGGSVAVKGNQFHVETDNGMEIICDGENICNYNKEDEEVTLYEYDESEDGIMTPTKVADMYKDGYRYRMIPSQDPTCHAIELIPDLSPQEREKQAVTKIKIFIKKSDSIIKKWQIFERTGNKYTVTVNSFTSNVALPSNQFLCNKSNFPSGIDFNDLR